MQIWKVTHNNPQFPEWYESHRTLQTEADINGGPVGLVLADGLAIRQNFCNIVNSIWGIGLWCEVNENISGADLNGDGMISEENGDGMQNGVEGGAENGNDAELWYNVI